MKTKKIALLSFLACACLAGGVAGMSASNVSANASNVNMKPGASLRVPVKDADAAADKDGIRFRAEFDREWVKGLPADREVGMFIAPAYYNAQTPITAESCFGATAAYCWGGAQEGKKEIIKVEGYAYNKTEESTVLTMDASIWNLKPTSLGIEFVGVAYLRAGSDYYFAQATSATPVSVAQQALLNESDAIYNIEGDDEAPTRVANAYITPYVGAGKEYTYTENVYKQQEDGTYNLAESNTKTVTATSWNTAKAETEAPAKYVEYTAKSSSKVINLVGDNTNNVYYNYAGNRVVIWDGDENLAEDDTFRVANKAHIEANPDFGYMFEASDKAIYEGKSGIVHGNKIVSWGGPYWASKVLPAATNTFSVILRTDYDMPNFKGEFKGVTDTGEDTGWLVFNSSDIVSYEVLDTLGKESCEIVDSTNAKGAPVLAVDAGVYKLTFTLPVNVASLSYFEFSTADMKPFYIDNFCAENIKVVGTTDVPHVFEDTLTFPAPAVIDTTVWDGEVSDLAPNVTYKSNLDADFATLTAEDGVYSITPTEGAYKYEIVVNGQSYTTVNGVSLVNFDDPIEERGYIGVTSSSSYGMAVGHAKAEGGDPAIQINEIDGKGALCINQTNAWLYAHKKKTSQVDGEGNEYEDFGKNFEKVAGFVPTKVGVWVYATADMNLDTYTYGSYSGASTTQYGKERNVPIKAGYSYVEYTFNKTLEGTYAIGFGMGAAAKQCYIFEFVLIA